MAKITTRLPQVETVIFSNILDKALCSIVCLQPTYQSHQYTQKKSPLEVVYGRNLNALLAPQRRVPSKSSMVGNFNALLTLQNIPFKSVYGRNLNGVFDLALLPPPSRQSFMPHSKCGTVANKHHHQSLKKTNFVLVFIAKDWYKIGVYQNLNGVFDHASLPHPSRQNFQLCLTRDVTLLWTNTIISLSSRQLFGLSSQRTDN